MRVSIFEIARLLDLDEQAFRELLDQGKLEGIRLDQSCLQKARRALFGDRCRPPPKRKAGRHD
jgi:hypothetical protein